MPTYEYECRHCGHAFEAFQSMTDKPLRKCPECGGHVRRLIGAGAGVIFKGSGFHATDYRSTSYAKAAKADGPKADSKAESKACPAKAGKANRGGTCPGGSCSAA
jgi:putative FmdB family regulatory protein